ncbi:MAG: hypothetical protein L6Q97_02930 [Thermoanaerobaculia bacterium]|nr:hypothetical protein [Thermoanaerobaculia bacterium]
MQSSILDQIVAHKRLEIKRLYEQFDFDTLRRTAKPSAKNFYRSLASARAKDKPFFITEFKRKSPSEGWINRDADLQAQVQGYARAGARAVSILTDSDFFGGSYGDLRQAAAALQEIPGETPLLLQKDFILDPVQIYLARLHGADIILLIAAILPPDRLQMLRHTAESLGMGVLVEVHNREELDTINHLDFPALGINSRDLRTFRTALNRVNILARFAGKRFVIAESGIRDYRDFQVVRRADGFLIGTSLMRIADCGLRIDPALGSGTLPMPNSQTRSRVNPQSAIRNLQSKLLFKACGIRTPELLDTCPADFIGLNFSPVSKRRIDPALLEGRAIPAHAVAVFYQNSEIEIREILARFPFQRAQLYAGDMTPAFVRSLRQKVLLACRVGTLADLDALERYAPDVDLFILDGPHPGSGQPMETAIPADFPYPFLLAGGIHAGNLDAALKYRHCIGVDVASGIETNGGVDAEKMAAIAERLSIAINPAI